jgi:hypothetical protein
MPLHPHRGAAWGRVLSHHAPPVVNLVGKLFKVLGFMPPS